MLGIWGDKVGSESPFILTLYCCNLIIHLRIVSRWFSLAGFERRVQLESLRKRTWCYILKACSMDESTIYKARPCQEESEPASKKNNVWNWGRCYQMIHWVQNCLNLPGVAGATEVECQFLLNSREVLWLIVQPGSGFHGDNIQYGDNNNQSIDRKEKLLR